MNNLMGNRPRIEVDAEYKSCTYDARRVEKGIQRLD
jgi:hypothetical protein